MYVPAAWIIVIIFFNSQMGGVQFRDLHSSGRGSGPGSASKRQLLTEQISGRRSIFITSRGIKKPTLIIIFLLNLGKSASRKFQNVLPVIGMNSQLYDNITDNDRRLPVFHSLLFGTDIE